MANGKEAEVKGNLAEAGAGDRPARRFQGPGRGKWRSSMVGWLLAGAGMVVGCQPAPVEEEEAVREQVEEGSSFAEQVEFLRRHAPVEVLRSANGGVVAVSGPYQARVLTSALSEQAPGLGWINREFIQAGGSATQFDNYGGEDRFWLGPEGGQFSLFFPPDSPFELSRWQVPAGLNEGEWTLKDRAPDSLTFQRAMELTNYSGVSFQLEVERTVRLLSPADTAETLQGTLPETVRWVGFETINRVTNTGERRWERESGLLSVWILGMFEPFGTSYVVIPFRGPGGAGVVNDRYFGKVPRERLQVREDHLVFTCDGRYRSKIGIGPAHALPYLGSYSPSARLLTVVWFNLPEGASEYVNSMWELQEEPYAGDVVNSYNDGPPDESQPALGGFYELESSSPALALAPGESYTHVHRTLHLVGDPRELDPLAERVLATPVSGLGQ